MEQLIVIALVVIVFVAKNLIKRALGGTAENTEQPQSETRRVDQAPVRAGSGQRKTTEQEEKMRKFFEALGLPTDSLPPAPVAQKAPSPVPKAKTPPPIVKTARRAEAPPVRPAFMPAAAESISVGPGHLAPPSPASPAEMYAHTHISAPSLRPVSQRDLSPAAQIALELVSSAHSLRRSVVVNELLGKPLSMR